MAFMTKRSKSSWSAVFNNSVRHFLHKHFLQNCKMSAEAKRINTYLKQKTTPTIPAPSQETFYQQNSWMQPQSQPLEIYSKDKVSTLVWGKKLSKTLLKSDMFLVLKDQDLQQWSLVRKPKGWRIVNTNNSLLVPEIDILQGITGLTLKYPRTAWLHRNQKVRVRSASKPCRRDTCALGPCAKPALQQGPRHWDQRWPPLRLVQEQQPAKPQASKRGQQDIWKTHYKAANLIETGWDIKKCSCRKCTSKYNEIYKILYMIVAIRTNIQKYVVQRI